MVAAQHFPFQPEAEVVVLRNHLEAVATAVPYLTAADVATLNPGTPNPTGAIAVIAPGTGLGEAFLAWDGARYRAHPTEGGHVSFAPGTAEELELLQFLQPRFSHVSFERIGLCRSDMNGTKLLSLHRFD